MKAPKQNEHGAESRSAVPIFVFLGAGSLVNINIIPAVYHFMMVAFF